MGKDSAEAKRYAGLGIEMDQDKDGEEGKEDGLGNPDK